MWLVGRNGNAAVSRDCRMDQKHQRVLHKRKWNVQFAIAKLGEKAGFTELGRAFRRGLGLY